MWAGLKFEVFPDNFLMKKKNLKIMCTLNSNVLQIERGNDNNICPLHAAKRIDWQMEKEK